MICKYKSLKVCFKHCCSSSGENNQLGSNQLNKPIPLFVQYFVIEINCLVVIVQEGSLILIPFTDVYCQRSVVVTVQLHLRPGFSTRVLCLFQCL